MSIKIPKKKKKIISYVQKIKSCMYPTCPIHVVDIQLVSQSGNWLLN